MPTQMVKSTRMVEAHVWTCAFYVFVSALAAAPFIFVWHYWHEAATKGWSWSSVDSRVMYVDGAKTLITGSGIAVALLASSVFSQRATASSLVTFSAKVAVVCLISCVCLSLVVILALLRGHERAKARNIENLRAAGKLTGQQVDEGQLNKGELLFILVPGGCALSCFLVGFVFLGRIVFHF
jgi:hypothetical protein